MKIFIDTAGMDDEQEIVALLTEIVKHIDMPEKKKRKAKEIRESNRKNEKSRKVRNKYNIKKG